MVSKEVIRPNIWDDEKLELYVLGADYIGIKHLWARLGIYHLSHFYDFPVQNDEDNITPTKLVRALIGLLCLFGNPTHIKQDRDLQDSLASAGITLEYLQLDESEVKELNSHHYNNMKTLLRSEDKWVDLQKNPDGVMVMAAVILLTIVKSVNQINAEWWIKNRVRTFSGCVGVSAWNDFWNTTLYPHSRYLGMCYDFISANHSLRKSIFLILNSMAKSTNDTLVTIVCRDIIQLMRGAEMHHLVLIDTYLIRRYPELLSLHPLRDTRDLFERVIAQFKMENSNDVLFMKILHDRDHTSALNRQNFRNASIVATTCARFENPSFDHYYMDMSEKAQELSNWVTSYLEHRAKLAGYAVGESHYVDMGPLQKERYFLDILEDYKKTRGDPSASTGAGPSNLRKSISLSLINH